MKRSLEPLNREIGYQRVSLYFLRRRSNKGNIERRSPTIDNQREKLSREVRVRQALEVKKDQEDHLQQKGNFLPQLRFGFYLIRVLLQM